MSPIISYNKIMLTAAIFVKFEWSPTGKPVAARRSACLRRNASCRQALRHAGWLSAKAGKNPNFCYFVEEI